ncbi:MAG: hypothetical protein ABI175_25600 [Polyangiales bacterium]
MRPRASRSKPDDELAAATLARALRPSGFLSRLRPLTDEPCLHVGIDENGLGPVLGPMIVTGVAFRFRGPRPTSLGALVGDSKALVSHADVSLGEAWARALLAVLGDAPRSPADVVDRLSMDAPSVLRAPCPSQQDAPVAPPASDAAARGHHAAAMCWPEAPESFVADEALVEKCARTIRGWGATSDDVGRSNGRFTRRIPLEVVGLRASIVCASRLNEAKATGRHKFAVDLHEMERIALAFHAAASPTLPLDAVCGKVGGMGYYSDYFGPLSGTLRAIEAEGEMASAYRFPGLGRLTFLQDADAADPLVGLASIVGKYLRELLMGRIVRYMREAHGLGRASRAPDEQALPAASGYRDPNTKRFIAATELIRQHRGVPDRCFLRTS